MNLTPTSREYYQCFQKRIPKPDTLFLSDSSKTLLKRMYRAIHERRPSAITGDSEEPVLAKICADPWFATIPREIQREIRTMKYTKTYHLKIGHREIRVVLVNHSRSLDFCKRAIHKIERWLSFILSVCPAKCANTLSIYLCLTNHKKQLPTKNGALFDGGAKSFQDTSHNGGAKSFQDTSHNGGAKSFQDTSHNGGAKSFQDTSHNGGNPVPDSVAPIDTIHANTAFTTSCSQENSVFIYRKEEWFKVFLHESFHCLGLDFSEIGSSSPDQVIRATFPAVSPSVDVRLYESYCEMWAEIINLMFLCGPATIRCKSAKYAKPTQSNTRKSREVGVQCVLRLLKYERMYSVFQANKLLRHYGLTYIELFEPTRSYKEKTQAFSYYVMKSILMWNLDAFLQWCLANNPTPYSLEFDKAKVVDYAGLVQSKSRDASYMDAISKQIGVEKCGKTLATTMRMCLFEGY
jgi:hypothetical protein